MNANKAEDKLNKQKNEISQNKEKTFRNQIGLNFRVRLAPT